MSDRNMLDLDAVRERWLYTGDQRFKDNIEEGWLQRDIHDLLDECDRLRKAYSEACGEIADLRANDLARTADQLLSQAIDDEIVITIKRQAKL